MPDVIPLIRPDWPAPAGIQACATTRSGGVSRGAWAELNLGRHCGDDGEATAENQRRLAACLPAAPRWLKQVHGTRLIHLDDWRPDIEADAAWTDRPGQVAAILTADCLPILLADRRGSLVAALHAGWRGLAAGLIAQVIRALPVPSRDLLAWIGPGISAAHYEVDERLRAAFVDSDRALSGCFLANARGRWQADLKAIAAHQLGQAGLVSISDCGLCTAALPDRFYSWRRDGGYTGRQASLIWIAAA